MWAGVFSMRTETPGGRDGGRVLKKAICVLDYVCERQTVDNVSRMAEELGLPRGTLYRLLDTLTGEEVLTRGEDGSYRPGPRLLVWASAWQNGPVRVTEAAHPWLERIATSFNLCASLYVRVDAARVCIHRVESRSLIRPAIQVGEWLPLHAGSSGQVLLAWLPDIEREELQQASERRWPQTQVARPTDWWRTVRERGYALSLGERDPDLASLAYPLFTGQGPPTAALSLSAARWQFERRSLADLVAALAEAAERVQTSLGVAKEVVRRGLTQRGEWS